MDKQRNKEVKMWKDLLRPLYTYFSRSLQMLVRLHSSARLKAATILWKPLRVHVSKCASRLNQDHDVVNNHTPYIQATYKGTTCLCLHIWFSTILFFNFWSAYSVQYSSLLVYMMNDCGKGRAWSFVLSSSLTLIIKRNYNNGFKW